MVASIGNDKKILPHTTNFSKCTAGARTGWCFVCCTGSISVWSSSDTMLRALSWEKRVGCCQTRSFVSPPLLFLLHLELNSASKEKSCVLLSDEWLFIPNFFIQCGVLIQLAWAGYSLSMVLNFFCAKERGGIGKAFCNALCCAVQLLQCAISCSGSCFYAFEDESGNLVHCDAASSTVSYIHHLL